MDLGVGVSDIMVRVCKVLELRVLCFEYKYSFYVKGTEKLIKVSQIIFRSDISNSKTSSMPQFSNNNSIKTLLSYFKIVSSK